MSPGPLDLPGTSLHKVWVGSKATSGLALLQEVVESWRDPGAISGHDLANSFGTPLVYDTVMMTQLPSAVLLLCRLCNLVDRLEGFAGQLLKSYFPHTQGEWEK